MRIPRLGVHMMVLLALTTIYLRQQRQDPTLAVDDEYEALLAIRAYNTFIEATVARLESIPDEQKKREFVNALKPALESETRRFRERLVRVVKYGRMGSPSSREKYREEVVRLQDNAAKATKLLQRYALQ